MPGSDKRKQLLYLPEDMLQEIMREANRLDRSMSWTVQRAWCIARADVQKFPGSEFARKGNDGEARAPTPPGASAAASSAPAREARRDPDLRRTTTDLDRARAEADLREFLRGKFDNAGV